MAIRPLPAVVLAGSAIAGGGGAIAGAVGGFQIGRARLHVRRLGSRYDDRYEAHCTVVERTNEVLSVFGSSQESAELEVLARMRAFLERHKKQVRANPNLIVVGIDTSSPHVVEEIRLDRDLAGWVRGVTGSLTVGAATPQVLRRVAVDRAKASTGVPISQLHGAARESATRAAFGGGSLAAGGGGEKLGSTVLKVAPVGAGLLIAGLSVKNRGTKARTEADAYRAEVEVAISQLDLRDLLLQGVENRARELQEILIDLAKLATSALDFLESEPFDMEAHEERLRAALLLVMSVREVATAPITDEEGHLDDGIETLVVKYRDRDTENSNDRAEQEAQERQSASDSSPEDQ